MSKWKVPYSTTTDTTFKYYGNTFKLSKLTQNKFDDSWSFDLYCYETRLGADGVKLIGGKNMLEALNIGIPALLAFNSTDLEEEPNPANMKLYIFDEVYYG